MIVSIAQRTYSPSQKPRPWVLLVSSAHQVTQTWNMVAMTTQTAVPRTNKENWIHPMELMKNEYDLQSPFFRRKSSIFESSCAWYSPMLELSLGSGSASVLAEDKAGLSCSLSWFRAERSAYVPEPTTSPSLFINITQSASSSMRPYEKVKFQQILCRRICFEGRVRTRMGADHHCGPVLAEDTVFAEHLFDDRARGLRVKCANYIVENDPFLIGVQGTGDCLLLLVSDVVITQENRRLMSLLTTRCLCPPLSASPMLPTFVSSPSGILLRSKSNWQLRITSL